MDNERQLDLTGVFAPVREAPKTFPPVLSVARPDDNSLNPEDRDKLVFIRSHRATHYRLTLKRDGIAVVTIPARGSEREARHFADAHADWLVRARKRQEKRPRTDGIWKTGTQILWRGELLALDVIAESRTVRVGANQFHVARLDGDLRPALEKHFLRLAKIELPARTWELAAETGVPVTEVCVRNQRTRWGSCTSKGVISLNWRLVQAPVFVRDYIIYHELMHLREMNHSDRFWARVGEVCPYWRDAERWIKQNSGLLGM